ncbi:MAG TPA: tetratricopeptide repeat protein [Steroidobacteraceae bacterium]
MDRRRGYLHQRRWLQSAALLIPTLIAGLIIGRGAHASAAQRPYVPANDDQVLAELPLGVRHQAMPAGELARGRLDIALPLAQFHIARARATGDLRHLGYAEAVLQPWLQHAPVPPAVRVLSATIQQSRHDFGAALEQLDLALQADPTNAQAWLTRATVLRVLGRYDQAQQACTHLAAEADSIVTGLCQQSLRALTGHLHEAYDAVQALPQQELGVEVRAWRYSELGGIAERLGQDVAAEHWWREGLALMPDDFYARAACADLLLGEGRAAEARALLAGYQSMEPMLLRIVLADQMLGDRHDENDRALLASAFQVEEQRGEAVHRREQARFLLDVERAPKAALRAAQQNWLVQREPEDALILVRAAQAAARPEAATPALDFVQQHNLQDVRLQALRPVAQ